MRVTLAITLTFAVSAGAQEPTRAPETVDPLQDHSENLRMEKPEVPPPTAGPARVTAPSSSTPKRAADRVPESGPWQGARAVRTRRDEAIVRFLDGERTLRPGDPFGEAVVREVDEGLIVLDRPALASHPGGAARIVIRFDASGTPSIRTIHEKDPTRVEPVMVR
jgi:hypothetical protein